MRYRMSSDMVYNEIISLINHDVKALDLDCAGSEMLLLALVKLKDSMTNLIFKELSITIDDIMKMIKGYFFLRKENHYTANLEEILMNAKKLMHEGNFVYDEAYLYSLLKAGDNVAKVILKTLGVEESILYEELEHAQEFLERDSKILINMTKLAKEKKLNPFIGRVHYLDKVDRILSRKQKNNPMLIGAAGVGKTGIVEGLVQYYLVHKPQMLVYRLDLSSIIAGTRYRGDLEERLLDAIEEIKAANAIVFIDEIHNILSVNTNEASLDIANILKPVLSRSEIKCIGATTTEEYYRYIEKDKALVRRFQNVFVEEVDDEECFTILKGIKSGYEEYYLISYSDSILQYIITSSALITNRRLPDKAIDILDEAGIIAKRQGLKEVNKTIIDDLIFENLGLNRSKILTNLTKTLNYPNLKPYFYNYLSFQKQKVIVSLQCTNYDLILEDIFKVFENKKETILEIDMNDFIDNHYAANLIGAPAGYVGYENGGILTDHLLKHPFAITIFKNYDEVNPVIHSLIEKALVNGMITDNHGRQISLRNSIFIFVIKTKKAKLGFITQPNFVKPLPYIDEMIN